MNKMFTSKSDLKEATGYWSGNKILFNDTTKIALLEPELDIQKALSLITSYVAENLYSWVEGDILTTLNYNAKKYLDIRFSGYYLREVPDFIQYCAKTGVKNPSGKTTYSHVRMINNLRSAGKNNKEIAKIIADGWMSKYESQPHNGITEFVRVGHELITIAWEKTQTLKLEELLVDLYRLSSLDLHPGRFDSQFIGYNGTSLSTTVSGQCIKENMTDSDRTLINRYSDKNIDNIMNSAVYSFVCQLKRAATHALIIFRENKICLLPTNCTSSAELLDKINISEEVYGTTLCNTYEICVRTELYRLYVNSTITSLKDIPSNLRDLFYSYKKSINKTLALLLKKYEAANQLTVFPYDKLKLSTRVIAGKYSLEWCEENLPEEWSLFVSGFWLQMNASTAHKAGMMSKFIEWGWEIRKFASPWDVKTQDLRNPYLDTNEITYFKYLKLHEIDENNKCNAWNSASRAFALVHNDSKLQGSPLHNYQVQNPFDGLDNPFTYQNRGGFKTVRKRIQQSVVEVMIETLIDPDENGVPTFSWPKENFPQDTVTIIDPANANNTISVWNPARATALATLLLAPPRGAQVRWFDQGLMDSTIYDSSTGRMIDNTHPLRDWKYSNGKTHEQQYGRPTGVLQFYSDALLNKDGLCIFVNTNKTQMWSGTKKTGYELPWPDGSELLASDEIECQVAGRWLNRVYQVLNYQLSWVQQYDPNPMPVCFFHFLEDVKRVDEKDEIRDQLPWFVPLFRDLERVVTYDYNGKTVAAHGPVSKRKIERLFNAVSLETERRLKEQGINYSLTIPSTTAAAHHNGYVSRYDIHSLRVAGISNLIEMGVPPEVVQIAAGHSALTMTLGYHKYTTPYLREILLEAMSKSHKYKGIADIFEQLKNGQLDASKIFVNNSRCGDPQIELPEDFSAFAPVEGGLCRMGGKGSRCDIGDIYYKTIEVGAKAGEVKKEYGMVRGGCGNCRFFTTGTPFLQEQEYFGNLLMLKMRSLGRERKKVFIQIADLEITISECVESKDRYCYENQKMGLKQRITNYDETLNHMRREWTNRLLLFLESGKLLEKQDVSNDSEKWYLITGTSEGFLDYTPEMIEATDFELVRRIVESSRFLKYEGVPVLNEASITLTQFMDIILDEQGCKQLLFRIKNPEMRLKSTSLLANFYAWSIDGTHLQRVIEGEEKLTLPAHDNEKLLKLADLVISAAYEGNEVVLDRFKEMDIHSYMISQEQHFSFIG